MAETQTKRVAAALNIEVDTAPAVHYVHYHAGIPLIQRLVLRHAGNKPFGGGTVEIDFSPAFARKFELRFDGIEAGGSIEWGPQQPRLIGEFLAGCTETALGEITVRVRPSGPTEANGSPGPGGVRSELVETGRPSTSGGHNEPSDAPETSGANRSDAIPPGVDRATNDGGLAEVSQPVSILAFNEWPGLGSLPELLAAYVTPNQPCMQEILHAASRLLKETTDSDSVDGYQSADPRRVFRIVEAVFHAVHSRRLAYINPPPSYEAAGQKLRFAEQVWLGRQAACLDLTLLFAGALEAAGLHSLILLENGHAYAGCWLRDDRLFDLAFETDLQQIRKCADLQDLCVFETTLATSEAASFTTAEQAGREHLINDAHFRFALDVECARGKRVLPLPIALEAGRLFMAPEPESTVLNRQAADKRAIDRRFGDEALDAALQPLPEPEPADLRIAHWKRQLLDLSLRNKLLNLPTGRVVPLNPGSLATLEDHLAEAGELRLLPKADPDPRFPQLHAERTGELLTEAELVADLSNHKLRTDETRESLEKKLVKLERETRLALDETGANILYLALGILEWREHAGETAPRRYAPLLLMPVRLERKSVRSGFRLRRLDEETQVNITLLEKLRSEFQIEVRGVDPLPEGEAGVDVNLVLRRFRKAVRDTPGFEVREDAYLGLFSFAKFLLWKDLKDRLDDLKRNPVVFHLVDHWGKPFAAPENDPILPEELDDRLAPTETFNVLEADSSQLTAMANAGMGHDFVLDGPPGTGKSQSIANIIAHCLALKKSVLFLAEKSAALQVVQRRLEKIGLGAFCLELHSHKTGKTAFIKQLREAVEFGGRRTPEEWHEEAERLQDLRQRLNAFSRALHARCRNGLSPYSCYGVLIPIGGRPPFELEVTDPTEHTRSHRRELRELLETLSARLAHFPDPGTHPLAPMGTTAYSFRWEEAAVEKLSRLEGRSRVCAEARDAVISWLKLPDEIPPRRDGELRALSELAGLILKLPDTEPAFFKSTGVDELEAQARTGSERAAAFARAKEDLRDYDRDKLFALDLAALEKDWRESRERFVLFKALGRRKVLKCIRTARTGGAKVTADAIEPLFEKARAFQSARIALEESGRFLEPLLGKLWNAGRPDDAAMEAAVKWARRFHSCLARLFADDFSAAAQTREQIALIAEQGRPWLEPGQSGHEKLTSFRGTWSEFIEAWETAAEVCSLRVSGADFAELCEEAATMAEALLAHRNEWQRWTRFQQARREAVSKGLKPLVEAMESGRARHGERAGSPAEHDGAIDVVSAFDQGYAWATLRILLDREPVLRDFFGDEHDQLIERFRKVDARMLELNRQWVVACVAANRPEGLQDERALGEIATLRAEIVKQRRIKPVRSLLGEIPLTLPRVKPCLLMSPLSVAQYLDAGHRPFDVVIFDEASQIPVCDAIGALARGNQTIIAGDPRQLPPTSFFTKIDLDDDADDAEAGMPLPPDQESILDECLAAGVRRHHLTWHYRSRREALIAFSNEKYYGNRLTTFPEPEADERGVFFHPIESGFYDRGGSQTNQAEAETIVKAVREHVLNPDKKDHTLAVITFNAKQQTLIENLVDQARSDDSAFDEAMKAFASSELEEPFKVRNLENIQGDERDIIFFSITFGPDRTGHLSHNFGPINQRGGERRLNVAVTRARREVHVFSSMRSSMIDLNRSSATGVLHLKDYLQYAQDGVRALATTPLTDGDDTESNAFDSAFEQFVADSLRTRGWNVHTRVGCSGYRIDLAVVHPDAHGDYLAGVECDGATYHNAATARDRDRLRQGFLESLGWRILRVWSTDWFRDAPAEIDRLDRRLRAFREEVTHYPASEPRGLSVEETPPSDYNKTTASDADASAPEAAPENEPDPDSDESTTPAPIPQDTGQKDQAFRQPPYPLYQSAQPPGPAPDKALFHRPESGSAITEHIQAIIDTEAPISESLLIDRVRSFWNFSRTTDKVKNRIQDCIPGGMKTTESIERVFYWRPDQEPDAIDVFRGSLPHAPDRRKLEDIAPREVAAAMAWLIERYAAAEEEDLLRETALVFGWKALTQNARVAMGPGLDLLLNHGYQRDGNRMIRRNPSAIP